MSSSGVTEVFLKCLERYAEQATRWLAEKGMMHICEVVDAGAMDSFIDFMQPPLKRLPRKLLVIRMRKMRDIHEVCTADSEGCTRRLPT